MKAPRIELRGILSINFFIALIPFVFNDKSFETKCEKFYTKILIRPVRVKDQACIDIF